MNIYNAYKIVLSGGSDSSQPIAIFFDGRDYYTPNGPLELTEIDGICDICNRPADLMFSDRDINFDVCMECIRGPRGPYEDYMARLSRESRVVPAPAAMTADREPVRPVQSGQRQSALPAPVQPPVQPHVNAAAAERMFGSRHQSWSLSDTPISLIQNESANCWFNSLLQFLSRFPNAANIDPAIRSQFSLNLANLINFVRQGLPINYQVHIRDSIFNQWRVYCDSEIRIELKQSIFYTFTPPNNWKEEREIRRDLSGQQDPVEFLPLWSQLLGWPVIQYGDLGIRRERQTLQGFINRNGLLHRIHGDIAVIVRDRDQQDFNGDGHQFVNRSILQFSETVNIVEDGAEVQFTPVSVIVHNGVDATGHYRCFVRDGSNWVILDDDREPRIAEADDIRHLETGSRIIHFRRLHA